MAIFLYLLCIRRDFLFILEVIVLLIGRFSWCRGMGNVEVEGMKYE